MFKIQYANENNDSTAESVDGLPNECPDCHAKIQPTVHGGLQTAARNRRIETLRLFMRCPNATCRVAFIAYYELGHDARQSRVWIFKRSEPTRPQTKEFSEIILSISSDFVKLFAQAHRAEQYGLDDICGAGYRKSLEFLVKDYAIGKNPDSATLIREMPLGSVIKTYIPDTSPLRVVAERATWLGNDETHYERKWADKDLSDMKRMIDLAVHWLEAEALTEQALKEMPAPTKLVDKSVDAGSGAASPAI